MTPSLPKDERMKDIMPIIKQAFQRRPVEVVPPEVHPDLSQVVGHFWRVEDFSGLPESLTSLLQRTHDAERREVEHEAARLTVGIQDQRRRCPRVGIAQLHCRGLDYRQSHSAH